MVEKYLNDRFIKVKNNGEISFQENLNHAEKKKNRFDKKSEAVNCKNEYTFHSHHISETEFAHLIKRGWNDLGFTSPLPQSFQVQYDHLFVAPDGEIAYLFDSKYYNNMSELDYKQLAYSFIYKGNHKEEQSGDEKKIIAGLILPTSEKIRYRCHCDRIAVDGIAIYEYYLPVRDVISNYLQQ